MKAVKRDPIEIRFKPAEQTEKTEDCDHIIIMVETELVTSLIKELVDAQQLLADNRKIKGVSIVMPGEVYGITDDPAEMQHIEAKKCDPRRMT